MVPVSRALGHEIAMVAWFVAAQLADGWVVWLLIANAAAHFCKAFYYAWRDNENRT